MSSALDYLRTFTDYEQKQPVPDGRTTFDLGRMRRLLAQLGDPHRGRPSIHITGTKGKGSVTHLADAILRAHGVRTMRFISPHVERINERIAIDGVDLTDEALDRLANRLRPLVETLQSTATHDVPTFFESITALAFLAARDAATDADVLEVGLGGRLDATNVVDSTVSVVTSIDLDHTKILGDTHDLIALEKAGIMRRGRPVLIGLDPTEPGFGPLLTTAAATGAAPLHFGDAFLIAHAEPTRGPDGAPGVTFDGRCDGEIVRGQFVAGGAAHQARNALLAHRAAREIMRELGRPFDPTLAKAAVAAVRIPARAEWFDGRPGVLLDGAHTPKSCAALAGIVRHFFPGRRTVLLLAHTNERDPGPLFAAFATGNPAVFTAVPSPRAADPASAASGWRALGLAAEAIADPAAALARALELAGPDGVVIVAGSFYLAGAVRPLLRARTRVV